MTASPSPHRAIEAIDEAYARATPGLWGWCTTGEKCNAAMLGTFFTFDDACTPLGGHVERWGENGKQVADWDEAIAYKEDNANYANFDFITTAKNNWPAARAHIRTLEEQVARLTAIVDRLPVTKDGVPVLPDDRVWALWSSGDIEQLRVVRIFTSGWFVIGPSRADDKLDEIASDHDDAPACYSTREAAAAALASSGQDAQPAQEQ